MNSPPSTFTPAQLRLFRHGIALFNAGDWFHAHETWEDLWHTLAGQPRGFVQGLIQLAVALEHVRRGNPRGALTMFDRARPRFAPLPSPYLGIDHRSLLADLATLLAPLRDLPDHMLKPRVGPGLPLPVNLQHAPRIRLQ